MKLYTITFTEREIDFLNAAVECYSHVNVFEDLVQQYGFVEAVRETAAKYDVIDKLNKKED